MSRGIDWAGLAHRKNSLTFHCFLTWNSNQSDKIPSPWPRTFDTKNASQPPTVRPGLGSLLTPSKTTRLFTTYQNFTENPVGKYMEHDLLGRSIGNFPGATEHLKRQSCFSGRNVPSGNLCSIFSKSFLIPGSGLRGRFLVNGTDLLQMVNAIPGRNLPALNFAYHLPRPWTDRFTHVNGKQPASPLVFFRLHWPDWLASEHLARDTFQQFRTDISTWIQENRVSKNFASSLSFPCFSLFTVLFAYVVFFGCLVLRDLCRSGCRQNFEKFLSTPSAFPPSLFFPWP